MAQFDCIRNTALQFCRLFECTLHAFRKGRVHDFGTERTHDILLLLREFLGYREHHMVAAAKRRQGYADPRIPRRNLDDRIAFVKSAGSLRIFEQCHAHAILR